MTKKDFQNWSREKLLYEYKELLKRKKFGIVWEDKTEEVAEQCKTSLPVLKDEKNKSFSTDKNGINHIFIEGDNYHALSVLNYTHRRKIDVIYIDPPYNTGNNDFIYNDKFVDKEDHFRHSKWLSFIEKRLKLARNILKEEGVIFISIDDNEQAPLKMICDEIFREQNFVATIIWQRAYSPKNQSRHISVDHEYILVYAKNITLLNLRLLPRDEKMNARYKNPDDDPRDVWKSGDLVSNEERKNGHYVIVGPKGDKFNAPAGKHWSFSQETMLGLQKDNRLFFGKGGNAFPSLKQFLSEVQQGRKASTLFFHEEVGHTDEAKKELKNFFEQSENLFPTPKPTRLIKQILRLINNQNAIVLDFMAGSGTTGHAVLELNKEDNGNRQFILCTNNEDNNGNGTKIATDICYPRIKKVIKGYSMGGKKNTGLGGNLRYYSTELIGNIKTDNDKRVLTSRSTEMLCLAEATFDEVVNKKGLFAIYENQKQMTGIIFDEDAITDFKKEAKKHKKSVVVYVFSYDHTYNEEDFEDLDNLKVVKPIPEVILNVYRKIYKELYKPRNL
ncbi:MAG: site-specific DNA-methyltransferase [Candidatus Omnitrophota bacterium]